MVNVRSFHLSFRRSGERRRRITALALLAVQGVIAASPLWEPKLEAPLRSHAEREAARHPGMHNEATCGVCAVRLMSASLPVRVVHADTSPGQQRHPMWEASASAPRDVTPANLSRAPPLRG
jgi:hypothetical protein